MRIAGIVLIVIGIAMLAIRGFSFTEKKKVVVIGPVEINKDEKHHVSWPVYAGGIAVAAGVIMVIAGKPKK